jgi:hypothetical protein
MPEFSKASKAKLATCHPDIQKVMNEVIKYFDCTIIEGHRGSEAQNKAYNEGKSEVIWPLGKHNKIPSEAVDAMPYPIDWKDINRLCYFAGFVVAIGLLMGVKIRWGKDWDMDTDLNDQTFKDGPHFELVED